MNQNSPIEKHDDVIMQDALPDYGVAPSLMQKIIKIRTMRLVVVPLLAAIIHVESNGTQAENFRANLGNYMRLLSAMINQAVMMGKIMTEPRLKAEIALGHMAEQHPFLQLYKLEMAGLAVHGLIEFYKNEEKIPPAAKCTTMAQTWLNGAENMGWGLMPFPFAEQLLAPMGSITQQMPAMTGLCRAVDLFNFGKNEEKLIREITDFLNDKTDSIIDEMTLICNDFTANQGDNPTVAYIQNSLQGEVKTALCALYEECHYAEMQNLAGLDEQARSDYLRANKMAYPLSPVWALMDEYIQILLSFMRHI